jgi:hypothetical protein
MTSPFLAYNEDLHNKFVRHCTLNSNDLSLNMAREYVTETLIETGFPLTNDFTAEQCKEMLQKE